jgi:2,3-bisphosphoglycerate-dependent phosphoglycerate mutase
MSIEVVFETHALSEDNESGIATGWLPGRLSERGRANAAEMGRRRREDGIAAVFTSDLRRAAETAEIAFGDTDIPVLYDWRLRECDFGSRKVRLRLRFAVIAWTTASVRIRVARAISRRLRG